MSSALPRGRARGIALMAIAQTMNLFEGSVKPNDIIGLLDKK
jgi:hypothetical protein